MKREQKKSNLKFSVYLTSEFMNTSLEALDLSMRSHNCLRRAGFSTIGEVVDNINSREDLLRFKNLGTNSAEEIMSKIFKYHYEHIPENKKEEYENKVAKLNGKTCFADCFLNE